MSKFPINMLIDQPKVIIPDNLLSPIENRYINNQFIIIAFIAFKHAKQQAKESTDGKHQTFKKLTY